MRAIIRKWVAQIVTISMLAGCVLPQGQTIWGGGNNTLSQNSATAPDSDDAWDGEIKLEIDPALMGDKYKHLKKVPFVSDTEGEDFSIQSSRHYKNYKKYLKPEFQCVQSLPDGSYRAYFGYHNTNNNTINIPIGSKNKVLPAEPMRQWRHKNKKKFDQGQPTRFTPGRVGPFPNSAFSVDFDHGNVHWLLNGKIAKANKRSTDLYLKKWTPEKRGLHLKQKVKEKWEIENIAKNLNRKLWPWLSRLAVLKQQEVSEFLPIWSIVGDKSRNNLEMRPFEGMEI